MFKKVMPFRLSRTLIKNCPKTLTQKAMKTTEQKLQFKDDTDLPLQPAPLNPTSWEEGAKTQAEQTYYHFQDPHTNEQVTDSLIVFTKLCRSADRSIQLLI